MQHSVPLGTSDRPRKRALLALAGITLAGFLLRIVWAASEPLWVDEGLTLAIAEWPALDLLLRPVDPTPGLYYLLHKWLIPVDAGLVAIRSISIAAGTLAIPAVYVVGRLAIDRSAGLLAAALLALSPVLIDYSQEARAYALQLFLVLVSAAGLLAWERRLGRAGGGGALALFAAATVLAYSAHLASIFWVFPAGAIALWATFRRGTAAQKRWFAAALALMAVAAVPETIRLVWRAALGGGFVWLEQASAADALSAWGRTLLPLGPLGSPAASTGILLLIAILIGWRLSANREQLRAWIGRKPVATAAIATMLLAPVAVWLFGFLLVPIFMPRTILVGIVGFILALALVARLERRSWLAPALIVLFASSLLLTGPVRAKEDWRSAAAVLADQVRPGEAVIACPEWTAPALRHAVAAPLRSPVITVMGSRMVSTEPAIGSDPRWEKTYFRAFLEPQMRFLMKQPVALPITPAELAPLRRAWIVESECDASREQVIRSWFGEGQWTLALETRAVKDSAAIRVWRFDAEVATPRQLFAIRR